MSSEGSWSSEGEGESDSTASLELVLLPAVGWSITAGREVLAAAGWVVSMLLLLLLLLTAGVSTVAGLGLKGAGLCAGSGTRIWSTTAGIGDGEVGSATAAAGEGAAAKLLLLYGAMLM
jgi:hypothetical protein